MFLQGGKTGGTKVIIKSRQILQSYNKRNLNRIPSKYQVVQEFVYTKTERDSNTLKSVINKLIKNPGLDKERRWRVWGDGNYNLENDNKVFRDDTIGE